MSLAVQEGDSFRWWVLGATAMGMFAYGYAYDNPVALQRQMIDEYGLSNVQYNLLYSTYCFPNMLLPFISGIISDKIGYDWLIIIFFGLMVLAQGLFVVGCQLNGLFSVLITSRLLYGIGAESHALVETPLIYDYFKGKELAFALALHLSMARAGSSLNDICTYLIYTHFNNSIVAATGVSFLILTFFWICLIILVLVHRVKVRKKRLIHQMLKRKLRKEKKRRRLKGSESDATSELSVDSRYEIQSTTSFGGANVNSSPDINNEFSTDALLISGDNNQKNDTHIIHDQYDGAASVTSDDTAVSKMKMSDIKQFDLVFWLLTWNCAIMYAIVLSWMNIGSDFLQVTYGYSHGKANSILTIPYTLAGVLQPIWGAISDKVGWRAQFLLISSFIFVCAHYVLGWIHIDGNPVYVPIIGLTLLGLGYSIFTAVIWPSFPLVVPPRTIGTAYGIPTSGYNFILTIYYLMVGFLTTNTNNTDKYIKVQYFLLVTSMSSAVTALWLIWKDKKTGWRLYPSAFADF
eukprot:381713_1